MKQAVVAGLVWLALGLAGFAMDSLIFDGHFYATLALAVLATLFGLWVFWRDGGSRVTAVGAYNLAFAAFVGFAGIYQATKAPINEPGVPLLTAIAICYFVHVSTWLIFWTRPVAPPHPRAVPHVNPTATWWATRWGAMLLLLAVLLALTVGREFPLVDAAGFVGVTLMGIGLLQAHRSRRLLHGVLPAAGFVLYFTYLFTGFGRIVIVSLGLALFLILADGGRRRVAKSALLLAAAPVVIFLGQIRATRPGGSVANVDPDGLGSAVGPLRSFARLLSLNDLGLLPYDRGHTFLSAAVALVPRNIWPDKPVGFGAEIVPFLSPHLVGTGHSDATLFFGEWLFNFGQLGLLLMVPVTGLAVRGVDRLRARVASLPTTTPRVIVGYLAGVLAVVGMFDLAWVGTFTYMARTGSRLLVLAVLFVLVAWQRRPLEDRIDRAWTLGPYPLRGITSSVEGARRVPQGRIGARP